MWDCRRHCLPVSYPAAILVVVTITSLGAGLHSFLRAMCFTKLWPHSPPKTQLLINLSKSWQLHSCVLWLDWEVTWPDPVRVQLAGGVSGESFLSYQKDTKDWSSLFFQRRMWECDDWGSQAKILRNDGSIQGVCDIVESPHVTPAVTRAHSFLFWNSKSHYCLSPFELLCLVYTCLSNKELTIQEFRRRLRWKYMFSSHLNVNGYGLQYSN